jgi:hypothetical protein
VVCAEFLSKGGFFSASRNSGDAKAHVRSKLNSKMTQATNSLNSH